MVNSRGDRVLRVRIIGLGRAGGAIGVALSRIGLTVLDPVGRGDDLVRATADADLVILAIPDSAIASVAAALPSSADRLVVHLAGSLGREVLGDHPRRGALHPLVSIPDARTGAERLGGGAWFALDGDEPCDLDLLAGLVKGLGGHAVRVKGSDRAAYHAAATIASNHLVALFGQVERIAGPTGVPREAFVHLARQTLEGLTDRSPSQALSGPVSRGDWTTVAAHLEALDPSERAAYAALAEAAARLVEPPASMPGWLRAVIVDPRVSGPGEAL